MLSLARIGPAVLEPALRAREATDEPEMRSQLATVLAELGVRDERIYQAVLEQLEDEPGLGASSFSAYGDQRALVPLSAMLDELDGDDPEEQIDVVECAAAIESLGGTLTTQQQAKAAAARRAGVAHRRGSGAILSPALCGPERLGGNSPDAEAGLGGGHGPGPRRVSPRGDGEACAAARARLTVRPRVAWPCGGR